MATVFHMIMVWDMRHPPTTLTTPTVIRMNRTLPTITITHDTAASAVTENASFGVNQEEGRARGTFRVERSSGRRVWPSWLKVSVWFCLFGMLACPCAWGEPPSEGEIAQHAKERPALERALRFLAAEVESWPAENGCYSCHNNGDAARALYRAMQLGQWPIRATASDSWLLAPERWQLPEGPSPDGDQRLADLQFALAGKELADVPRINVKPAAGKSSVGHVANAEDAAEEEGLGMERMKSAVTQAAERVRLGLERDRNWPADPTSPLGSPVTYGPHLGTALVRQLLGPGNTPETQRTWRRTRRWLLSHEPQSTLAAASRMMGLTVDERRRYSDQIARSRQVLTDSQQSSGGWGPYAASRPEIFDTAVALIALSQASQDDEETHRRIRLGREYLMAQQWKDGSWTETTRPGGRESYAQRISTTAWATLALLETARLVRIETDAPVRE